MRYKIWSRGSRKIFKQENYFFHNMHKELKASLCLHSFISAHFIYHRHFSVTTQRKSKVVYVTGDGSQHFLSFLSEEVHFFWNLCKTSTCFCHPCFENFDTSNMMVSMNGWWTIKTLIQFSKDCLKIAPMAHVRSIIFRNSLFSNSNTNHFVNNWLCVSCSIL